MKALSSLRSLIGESSLKNIENEVSSFQSVNDILMTNCQISNRKSNQSNSPLNIQTILLFSFGIFLGFCIASLLRLNILSCSANRSCCPSSYLINEILHENFPNATQNVKIFKDIEPNKQLVFVGVMTAQKYLDTRARAVYETWGKTLPGKISFFSRQGSSSNYNIPLVSLKGVDDSYPPQKKSFMMLKFMHDNYIDKFEWFMRVDDDVYIKHDKLERFLRSLNSSVPQFVGQAGLGNKEEFGLLSLDYDENFCMGGPGILMSRETLKRVVPHIKYCLKNLYSTHEDVEIGRCIRRFVNISCTWSYEMQHIFYHNSSGSDAYTKDLLATDVLNAISLHPIKKPKYLYSLHNFINQRRIVDMRQNYLNLEREVFKLKNELYSGTNISGVVKTFIQSCQSVLADRFLKKPSLLDAEDSVKLKDQTEFDFFTRSLFSSTYVSPKRGLEGFWTGSIRENLRQIMQEINHNSIDRGRIIDFKDLIYGYVRNHPLTGLDYIMDILLVYKKYEGRKMTVPVRRHAYLHNSFVTMLYRDDPLDSSIFINTPQRYRPKNTYQKETSISRTHQFFKRIFNLFKSGETKIAKSASNKTSELIVKDIIKDKVINFVVPLAGRWETFKRFMMNYEDICLRTNENVKLVIVLFEDEITDKVSGLKQSKAIQKLFIQLMAKYGLKDGNRHLNLILSEGKFSRSIGCELGADTFSTNDLIFFIDVDIAFTSDFLLRARLNTIEYKQVYYPIVFSEYDPDDTINSIRNVKTEKRSNQKLRKHHFDFSPNSGYWRHFGFGIVATYNSDLKRVGGFDKSIIGWGKEDVDLYEKYIKSNMTVFRTVDPGLVHVFHKIECDPQLNNEQTLMCIGSKSTSIASQRVLANLIYQRNSSRLFKPS